MLKSGITNPHQVNETVTKQIEQKEYYKKYFEFITQNGVLCKYIKFPVAFEQIGYTGLQAECDIPANTVIMLIPNKLILSALKASRHKDLGFIIHENQEHFDIKTNPFADLNAMVLLVIYEKQNPNSFYSPIFNATEYSCSVIDWPQEDFKLLEDEYFVNKLDEFWLIYQETKKVIHDIILRYSSLFHSDILNDFKKKFEWAFTYSLTRRLSICDQFQRTFLVPFADFINHGDDLSRFGLFNRVYENQDCNDRPEEYINMSTFLNFSHLLQNENFFQPEDDQDSVQQTQYRYLKVKEQFLNQEVKQWVNSLDYYNLYDQRYKLTEVVDSLNFALLIQDEERQIWNFNYLDHEDDDDEEDQDEIDLENTINNIQYQKSLMEELDFQTPVFCNPNSQIQQQKYEDQRKRKEAQEQQENQRQSAQVDDTYLKDYYQNLEVDDEDEGEDEEEENCEDKSIQIQQLTKKDKGKSINKINEQEEYKTSDQPNIKLKEKQQKYNISKDQDEVKEALDHQQSTEKIMSQAKRYVRIEENHNYKWYSDQDDNAYFMVYTNKKILKGQQILNHYSRNGNENLLLYSGFALENNKYERVRFRFLLTSVKDYDDFSQNIEKFIVLQYISPRNQVEGNFLHKDNKVYDLKFLTKELKLKRSRISLQLINFFRTYQFHLENEKKKLIAQQPKDYQQELDILINYKKVIQILMKPFTTSIEQDEEILKNNQAQLTYYVRTALLYRIEKKKILRDHELMVDDLLLIIQTLIKSGNAGNNFKKSYMQLCNNPQLTDNQKFGRFKKIYQYLKNVYEYIVLQITDQ